jgi:hypothetical protein
MLVRAELEDIKARVDRAATRTQDATTRLHLRDLSLRIEDHLDPED